MYILFPIGWMYYFGINLEDRFSVPDFWPTQDQSHRIPMEREEIVEEVRRIARQGREKAMRKDFEDVRQRAGLRGSGRGDGEGGEGGVGGEEEGKR
jgi:protein PET100, fungi type